MTADEWGERLGEVIRERLLGRLEAMDAGSLVLVVASAGSGKSTLLAQWSRRSERPVAVVETHQTEDTVSRLGADIARAIASVVPGAARIIERSQGADADWLCVLLPNLSAMVGSTSLTLVIDDVQHIRSVETLDFLRALVAGWPRTNTIVLSGRRRPDVGLQARQARPVRLFDEGDLGFDDAEIQRIVARYGAGGAAREILEWTGGWPAGLSLAAATRPFAGTWSREAPPTVTEYIETQALAVLDPEQVDFLAHVAVMMPASSALVDSVLNRNDTRAALLDMEHRGLPMLHVPSEPTADITIHTLLATVLRQRFLQAHPDRSAQLLRRAAVVHEREGRIEQAASLLERVGDRTELVSLVYRRSAYLMFLGDSHRVRALLTRFTPEEMLASPLLPVLNAMVMYPRYEVEFNAMVGRLVDDDRKVLPDGSSPRTMIRRLRVSHGFSPVDRSDVDPDAIQWELARLQAEATEDYGSDRLLDAGAKLERLAQFPRLSPFVQSNRLATLALIRIEMGDLDAARYLVGEANAMLAIGGLVGNGLTFLVDAAAIPVARRFGELAEAERLATEIRRKTSTVADGKRMWHAISLLAVANLYIELGGHTHVLRDLHDEATRLLSGWTGLTLFDRQRGEIRQRISSIRSQPSRSLPASAKLTTAELRVLHYLPSHYSIPRIAQELRIANSTAKTQCLSVYRKLLVNDRAEAVRVATNLGFLEQVS